jgi:hypothetical protein
MRVSAILPLLAIITAGCLNRPIPQGTEATAFDFRSSDVLSATAEPIDQGRLDTREGTPLYDAQLRLVLSDSGVRRLQHFAEMYDGQTVELRLNGEVLVPGVRVSQLRGGVREMSWLLGSLSEAEHFAASLEKQ